MSSSPHWSYLVAVTQLNYYAPPIQRTSYESRFYGVLMRTLIVYFLLSTITLPFIDDLWLGELPLLALIQLPKVSFASWLRSDVVIPLMRLVGSSRGSPSPDLIRASPYALAMAYVIPLGIFTLVMLFRRRTVPLARWPLMIMIALAALDYAFTLAFACGPGFTLY
jgi:hypothetical protein